MGVLSEGTLDKEVMVPDELIVNKQPGRKSTRLLTRDNLKKQKCYQNILD